ncbi:hypothetical protein H109_02369 [Trichophyton interdigitale MR816]|uniref:DUF7730 domain-containing protein n=1 Tax=Trichophyton interdigitale (strain MR816) TaxID=1215338 RepID=A0A059JDD8_TRIIM|nr:hypothetical protein H101_02601 [Trichophyton interdigitale H6]KDB25799.1 hypothetical protein H109_02369 [Trichophyton interdigitale MR816]
MDGLADPPRSLPTPLSSRDAVRVDEGREMPKFSQWIRKITHRGGQTDGHSERPARPARPAPPRRRLQRPRTPLIPILPANRRPLSLSYPASTPDEQRATENSLFFTRLPPEIRRMVYIAMFGARTIHISLNYSTSYVAGKAHARLDTIKRTDDYNLQWRWWHCVCHRYRNLPFWNDRCPLPQYTSCRAHYGDHSSCFIGVLEWLLTSRQCYTEAMPVLYHTNTFIINDEFYDGLFFKLPNLIPAHHVGGITSLELTSRIIPDGDAIDVGDHAALVAFLCSFFPHLRCLRLHIKRGGRFIERNTHTASGWIQPGLEGYRLVSAAIFYTTDQLVHHYSTKLKCLEVALDKYIYTRVLMVQPEDVIKTEESHPRQSWRRFWRQVVTHDGLNLGYYVMEAEDQVLIPIDTCL